MTEDVRSQHNVIQNTIRDTLLSQGMSPRSASESAAALADLWQRAELIRISIEDMAQGKESRHPLRAILRELEDLDWEALWLMSRIQRIWRHVSRSSWRPAQEELELTEESVTSWWRPKNSSAEAARRILELRRLARRLATALTTYDLLAIGNSRRVGSSRVAFGNLVERTRASAQRLIEMLR